MRDAVIVVIFDLPVADSDARHCYTRFRRKLKETGYMRMQKSVYVKRISNSSSAESEFDALRNHAPEEGEILAWSMTVGEFRSIQNIRGEQVNFDLLCSPLLFFENL